MFKNKTLSLLEKLNTFGWKLTLENITYLLEVLGNPHLHLKCVHIAGTNGKGSTAAMLESILRHAGYKTGLYTSPHLVNVNERIRVNGKPIHDNELAKYISAIEKEILSHECTYFETLTAIAFKYFHICETDIVIIEVGLGGRLDATNIIDPILSIITEIDFDHVQHLGMDITSIAREKAGIIKKETPCLIQTNKAGARQEFEKVAREKNAELFYLNKMCRVEEVAEYPSYSSFNLTFEKTQYNNLRINIPGRVQIENAALVVCATQLLQKSGTFIPLDAIKQGIASTVWPGRLELLQHNPTVLIDVAHNVASFRVLYDYIDAFFPGKRIKFAIGLLADKEVHEIVKLIVPKVDSVFVCNPDSNRALPSEDLIQIFKTFSVDAKILTKFSQVLDSAQHDEIICVTGSHYVVGDFLKYYKKLDK